MSLFLRNATYKEIKHSCLNYHYAKRVPSSIYYALSIFEDDVFKGVIMFNKGANNNLCKSLHLEHTECCELTRIAMKKHKVEVSRIIKIALSLLKRDNKGLKVVVSYADTVYGHTGVIYKASNWYYVGLVNSFSFFDKKLQKKVHPRSLYSLYNDMNEIVNTNRYVKINDEPKHKFLYFLDKKYKDYYMRVLDGKK